MAVFSFGQSNTDEYQPNETEEKNPYPTAETPGNLLSCPYSGMSRRVLREG